MNQIIIPQSLISLQNSNYEPVNHLEKELTKL